MCGVLGRNASSFLERVEESLDPVAHCIDGAVDGVLKLAVSPGRGLGDGAACAEFAAYVVDAVGPGGEHDLRVRLALGHQGIEGIAVVGFAR